MRMLPPPPLIKVVASNEETVLLNVTEEFENVLYSVARRLPKNYYNTGLALPLVLGVPSFLQLTYFVLTLQLLRGYTAVCASQRH